MNDEFSPRVLKKFSPGDVIFEEGETAKDLYVIITGEAEVLKKVDDKQLRLAVLTKEDFFGEMAFFSDEPRSATVKAITDLETYVIDENEFSDHLENIPAWFRKMVTILAKRIKDMDTKLAAQYKTGIEFSVLNLLKFMSEQYGTHTGSQLSLDKGFFVEKTNKILGVTLSEIDKHFVSFSQAGIVEFEDETEKVLIKDKVSFERFLDFYQTYVDSSKISDVQSQFPQLSEEELSTFYYQYNVIHKKGNYTVLST